MFKKALLISFLIPSLAFSQLKLKVGIEQDILPYATGGYFAGGWVGANHIRLRAVMASVNKPDFMLRPDFTNNKIKAYALVCDYFLKQGFNGWYAGTGMVKWNGSIQSQKKIKTASYSTTLLNGTLGYNLKLNKHFYVSPWAGLHLKIGGTGNVKVDDKIYKPSLFNPEASLKIGLRL